MPAHRIHNTEDERKEAEREYQRNYAREHREERKRYREANRDEINKKHAEWRRSIAEESGKSYHGVVQGKWRKRAFHLLGNKCKVCSEADHRLLKILPVASPRDVFRAGGKGYELLCLTHFARQKSLTIVPD